MRMRIIQSEFTLIPIIHTTHTDIIYSVCVYNLLHLHMVPTRCTHTRHRLLLFRDRSATTKLPNSSRRRADRHQSVDDHTLRRTHSRNRRSSLCESSHKARHPLNPPHTHSARLPIQSRHASTVVAISPLHHGCSPLSRRVTTFSPSTRT